MSSFPEFARCIIRCAGLLGLSAWCLLALAIYLAGFRAKKHASLCLIVIAWYLAAAAAVQAIISSYDMIGFFNPVSFLLKIILSLATMVPALLLTIPALWFTFDGDKPALVWTDKLCVASAIVGIIDLLMCACLAAMGVWYF